MADKLLPARGRKCPVSPRWSRDRLNLSQPFVVAATDPYPAYAMFRVFSVVLSTLLLAPVTLAQHGSDGGAAQRQTGTIYKREVDGMIAAIRMTARQDVGKPAAPGVLGSDVLSTAKILAAMGHSHRRYHVSDGPVVRPSLDYLMKNRLADGSFGDAEATSWVLEAMQILNHDGYREEIRVGREWLQGKADGVVTFDALVSQLLQAVRADLFPEHMASDAARLPRKWQATNTIDRNEAATALVKLVACQQANLKLDKMAAKQSHANTWSATQEKAFAWLFSQQKAGVFSVTMPMKDDKGEMVMRSFPDPALTGFGLLAMQTKPLAKRTAAEQQAILAGLNWLVKQQNPDGTFGREVLNYTTCVVVGALARWKDPVTVPVLARAQKAILMFQNAEAGGYERSDRDFGSIGYGSSQRGDLSNTHFSMEALRASGLPEDHEAMQKALVFLQRTQNLKSSNDFKGKIPHPNKEGESIDVASGDDGGAAYYPGNSAAGYVVQPDGKAVARSYGSMTYALLKSYTLAGVKGDDPRVQAAVKWIQNNWTLAINPGSDPALGEKVKYQGLYYYYMVLAQALDAAEVETVEVPPVTTMVKTPRSIDWREALRNHLATTQQADGTWINGKNGRWMESLPLLCTCYSMIALEHCK